MAPNAPETTHAEVVPQHGEVAYQAPDKQWIDKAFEYFPGGYSQHRMIRFKNPKHMYQAINALAGLAILFYGYDQGVMSQVNINPEYLDLMDIDSSTSQGTTKLGGIVAIYYLGSLIGALMGGSLADRAGRIKSVVFGCCWSIIGACLQASAYNTAWMCCARVITGVGVGVIDAVIPVWSAEVSEHDARGAFLAIEFFLNILGLATAYWLEYLLYYAQDNISFAWRFPLAFQIIFLLVIVIAINFFPESPRWLCKMGRDDEALMILEATRSPGSDKAQELLEIQEIVEFEKRTASANRYTSMMFPKDRYQRELRWRVILAVWLQILQELVGIGVITVYAVDLFKTAGFSEQMSQLLAGGNNLSYTASTLFAVFTLDRFGRRSTLLWGAVAMAVVLIIGGVTDKYASETTGSEQRVYGSVVATMTFLYTGIFGATWLTVPWLYPTEIFPLAVRAKGGAWSVLGWSIGNGVVILITPYLFQAIGYGVLFLFAGLNIAVLPFVYFMYPETSGRTLEEMDSYFTDSDTWSNVFKAEKECREKGQVRWQWTKRAQGSPNADAAVRKTGGGESSDVVDEKTG